MVTVTLMLAKYSSPKAPQNLIPQPGSHLNQAWQMGVLGPSSAQLSAVGHQVTVEWSLVCGGPKVAGHMAGGLGCGGLGLGGLGPWWSCGACGGHGTWWSWGLWWSWLMVVVACDGQGPWWSMGPVAVVACGGLGPQWSWGPWWS